ncbi:hypothetical protein [Microvirga calopogonii]|uniref:hypothetical protein n=1 Tax=Microvirga calopogonii TaxID=2078013 RepID=UPI0013B36867|nr:hypothetical protein [Microvirga calopogonii]
MQTIQYYDPPRYERRYGGYLSATMNAYIGVTAVRRLGLGPDGGAMMSARTGSGVSSTVGLDTKETDRAQTSAVRGRSHPPA